MARPASRVSRVVMTGPLAPFAASTSELISGAIRR